MLNALALAFVLAQDPKEVEAAVQKGVAWLHAQTPNFKPFDFGQNRYRHDELVLLTLIRAGEAPNKPECEALFRRIMEDKLETTYQVALQALILEELDRVRFQRRLWQCAQFLVDNQSADGIWGYGSPVIYVEDIPAALMKEPNAGPPALPNRPKVGRFFKIEKKRDGTASDLSNTFYALLGLRACQDAGMQFQPSVFQKTAETIRARKKADGGWSYTTSANRSYDGGAAAGAGSLAICVALQKGSVSRDPDIQKGVAWLRDRWDWGVRIGPDEWGGGKDLHRLSAAWAASATLSLLGADKLGARDWHAEGVKALLQLQKDDGAWQLDPPADPLVVGAGKAAPPTSPVWDTCFAILFIRKGTPPLPDPAMKKK